MTSSEPQDPVSVLSKMTLENKTSINDISPDTNHVQHGEQIINPFEVVAADEYGVDYDKLIETFGTRKIDQNILDRFEKLTNKKPHRYLRRGHFFSQRYFFRKIF
jgi:hypothetical protein